MIRVNRLIAGGSKRRSDWGIMMNRYICRRERPKASALSYWLLGIEISAPLTRSPISAVPHKMKTMTEAVNPDRLIPNARVMPK